MPTPGPRYEISLEDVRNPARLLPILQRLLAHDYDLLGRAEARPPAAVASPPSNIADRVLSLENLLSALAVGGAESALPAARAAAPSVSALPPIATAAEGELVWFSGALYRFDSTTNSWIITSAALHNLLSATHPDTLAASPVLGDLVYGNATPAWQRLAGNIATAVKFLTQTGAGAVSAAPAWFDLFGTSNTFTAEQIFAALTALTLGSATTAHGAKHQFIIQDEEVNLAGVATKDSTANLLSGFSLVLPVLAFITQTISGGGVTQYKTGDGTTLDRFHAFDPNLTVGGGVWMFKHWGGAITTDAAGPTQPAAAKIRVTLDAAPTQGKIRFVTCNLVGTVPTS